MTWFRYHPKEIGTRRIFSKFISEFFHRKNTWPEIVFPTPDFHGKIFHNLFIAPHRTFRSHDRTP